MECVTNALGRLVPTQLADRKLRPYEGKLADPVHKTLHSAWVLSKGDDSADHGAEKHHPGIVRLLEHVHQSADGVNNARQGIPTVDDGPAEPDAEDKRDVDLFRFDGQKDG